MQVRKVVEFLGCFFPQITISLTYCHPLHHHIFRLLHCSFYLSNIYPHFISIYFYALYASFVLSSEKTKYFEY